MFFLNFLTTSSYPTSTVVLLIRLATLPINCVQRPWPSLDGPDMSLFSFMSGGFADAKLPCSNNQAMIRKRADVANPESRH